LIGESLQYGDGVVSAIRTDGRLSVVTFETELA
jgi:hypothetical protein